jgi:hypothetical protein
VRIGSADPCVPRRCARFGDLPEVSLGGHPRRMDNPLSQRMCILHLSLPSLRFDGCEVKRRAKQAAALHVPPGGDENVLE